MQRFRTIPLLILFSIVIFSCARMGQPDGGWFDETPPHVVSASPADRGVNAKSKKIVINFDEYIKLENPSEKVIISPPQMEQPDIKAAGRNIIVQLKDSLKENTTYTIDFSDAISDNNEGNPMGNYTYSFSTGGVIDTLEVAGYVLDAENLEPIKGTLVGLYRNEDFAVKDSLLRDSLAEKTDSTLQDPFRLKPLMRVSHTDSRGHFIIRGVAPGSYRVFSLQDADGDFRYSQAAEGVGFDNEVIVPTCKPDTRQDTLWIDSLHIKDIIPVGYTHFLPDELVLRQFVKEQTDRFYLKAERKDADHFTLFYSGPGKMTPEVKGVNFDSKDAFIIENTLKNDTVTYWLRDTALVNMDTLSVVVTHEVTDSLGALVMQSDSLEILAKVPYAKRLKELQKEMDEWYKKLEKRRKKSEEEITDTIFPARPFKPEYKIDQAISPVGRLRINFPQPVESIDTSMIHLYVKQGEDWYRAPFTMRRAEHENATDRNLEILAEWIADAEYSFEVDSTAFRSIYGLVSHPYKAGIKVNNPDSYSALFVNVSGASGGDIIVQLLNSSDKVVTEEKAVDGTAEFYYVKEGEYYLRAFVDRNGNGKWDTGCYEDDCQPEAVYYFPEKVDCRAKWDVKRTWNLTAKKLHLQKPEKITKQKGDKQKTIRMRNAERAREKGIAPPTLP